MAIKVDPCSLYFLYKRGLYYGRYNFKSMDKKLKNGRALDNELDKLVYNDEF